MRKTKGLSFTIPCGEGKLKLDEEGFLLNGVEDRYIGLRELEEIAIAINDALNLVDDYGKWGDDAVRTQ